MNGVYIWVYCFYFRLRYMSKVGGLSVRLSTHTRTHRRLDVIHTVFYLNWLVFLFHLKRSAHEKILILIAHWVSVLSAGPRKHSSLFKLWFSPLFKQTNSIPGYTSSKSLSSASFSVELLLLPPTCCLVCSILNAPFNYCR